MDSAAALSIHDACIMHCVAACPADVAKRSPAFWIFSLRGSCNHSACMATSICGAVEFRPDVGDFCQRERQLCIVLFVVSGEKSLSCFFCRKSRLITLDRGHGYKYHQKLCEAERGVGTEGVVKLAQSNVVIWIGQPK